MNSIVCVKQIRHIYIQNGYSPKTKGIVHDGVVYVLSPYDETALEAAIRLREETGSGTVTVVTVGPARAEEALRWCLAMGADKAIHLLDDDDQHADYWKTASLLAEVTRPMDYDLLFFGKKALDDEAGVIGTYVGELLGLPVVTAVARIGLPASKRLELERALDRGNRESLTCSLPAVLTVDPKLNRPRYPTFPGRRAAQAAGIRQIDAVAIQVQKTAGRMDTVRLAAPKLKPRKMLAPDSNLSQADQLKFIMTGGMAKKKGGAIGGDPKQMAGSIIEFLREKGVIGG